MKRLSVIAAVFVLAACASSSSNAPSGKIEVLWLGQAAFRITSVEGKVIVIDPFLTKNPKTPERYKDLKALGKVDAVMVTHGHWDHVFDAPALAKLNQAPLYGPYDLNLSMTTVGELPANLSRGMNKSGMTTFAPGITFTAVKAEHSSAWAWKDPATGKDSVLPGGEALGWIIELENGFRIYHMGDTGLFGDMKMIGELYKPDLVLVPIGGYFAVNPAQAAYAIRELIKPRFAIPMHYGTFPILAGKPEDFIKELGNTPTKVMVMQPGDALRF
jgi:L-ascorbate metabolism protein UlaG (beta-lactamase superfamily)